MKQVFMHQGKVLVEEIPAPSHEPGYSLVRVYHSCISTGTELSGLKEQGMPLWKKAIKNPEKVTKALAMLATQGFSKTKSVIQGKLSSGYPVGYSAAGIDLESGHRVACAGAQFANHAEIIRVPHNLVVPIPDFLSFAESSTVALGAIAMQGVRRASPTLGETFVVIGLGFLGQVTGQLLLINGCQVFGSDLDSHRIEKAKSFGIMPLTNDSIEVDGVIITAASASSEIVSKAFQLCRKKGRVVLVGDVGLNLQRGDFYKKEIDFLISTSYGPGRYDDRYEEKGLDYPIGYVRWTENRNMAEYLRLLAEKKIQITPLIHEIYPVEKAEDAYRTLNEAEPRPLLALLSYSSEEKIQTTRINPKALPPINGQIEIAVIGAGGFAKGMHLPNLQSLKQYHLRAIVSRSGPNAMSTAQQFQASYATTDFQEALKDPKVHAVLIATRHHLHTSMTLEALRAGKHVLVEKPLALNEEELHKIEQFFQEISNPPCLLTGFNRRFSPFAKAIYKQVENRTKPMVLNYRMNAVYIHPDHWVHGEEGGGRNIGEACHIYDLFTYLTNSEIAEIDVKSISSDNFITSLAFKDGSIATLTYTSLGSKEYPKEQMEVFVDGKVIVMNDYHMLNQPSMKVQIADKGQKDELIAFAKTIQEASHWPIPLWQQLQAMRIAFQVEKLLKK